MLGKSSFWGVSSAPADGPFEVIGVCHCCDLVHSLVVYLFAFLSVEDTIFFFFFIQDCMD